MRMLVSSEEELITIVEFVSIRDLQATEVEAFAEDLHQLFSCGESLLFCLPRLSRFGLNRWVCAGGDFEDSLAAAQKHQPLSGLRLGGIGFGVLLELLDGDTAHGASLKRDCTPGTLALIDFKSYDQSFR